MFELKHGDKINHALINDFKSLRYNPYYLIPGLDILAPLDLSAPVDTYLLNLFCCKPDTATKLEKEGFLITTTDAIHGEELTPPADFFATIPAFKGLGMRESKDKTYQQALNSYINSRDETLSKKERYEHLLFAFDITQKELKKGESKIERLSTYARISLEIGQRKVGVQICDHVIHKYLQNLSSIQISEPFIPVNQRFEFTDRKQLESSWLLASFIDEYIRKHSFSCYFSSAKIIPYFNAIRKLGFMHPDIKKREDTLLNIMNNK